MPKRKKSHEYCRLRFGIFKRRRVSTAVAASSCDDDEGCVVRVRRLQPLLKNSETTQHDLTSMAIGSHNSPPPVHFQQFSQELPSLACSWSSHCSGEYSGSRDTSQNPSVMMMGSSIMMAENRNLPPVQDYCLEVPESDERFQKVMSLVALTSSLKLSEDSNSHEYHTSDAESHKLVKETVDLTWLKPSSLNSTDSNLFSPVMSDLASKLLVCSVTAPSHSFVDMTSVDFRTAEDTSSSIYASRSLVRSYNLQLEHRSRSRVRSHNFQSEHRSNPTLPRVESLNDSSDSDEGFCEPVTKRAHKLASDTEDEPDEGVNTAEKIVPNQTLHRRSKYTNHLVEGSLCCSLYWQMMSNQYGIPTKIYSAERSNITHPFVFESHSSHVSGVEIKSARCKALGWTRKPFIITATEDKFASGNSFISEESFGQKQRSGIFAVGKLVPDLSNAQGTLGLCLQHAFNCNKSVFVFDCQTGQDAVQDGTYKWYKYSREKSRFVLCPGVPVLEQNFAGLGTNELPKAGRMAIKELFRTTFGSP